MKYLITLIFCITLVSCSTAIKQANFNTQKRGLAQERAVLDSNRKELKDLRSVKELELFAAVMEAVNEAPWEVDSDISGEERIKEEIGKVKRERIGKIEKVRRLVAEGVSVNATDKYGRTILHQLLSSPLWHESRLELVNILLDANADPNARDILERTPIFNAAANQLGDMADDIMRALLRKGAELEARDYAEMTPLLHAAESNKRKSVSFLLEEGANIKARDKKGRDVLRIARETHPLMVEDIRNFKKARCY